MMWEIISGFKRIRSFLLEFQIDLHAGTFLGDSFAGGDNAEDRDVLKSLSRCGPVVVDDQPVAMAGFGNALFAQPAGQFMTAIG
jgi:hypothetical protein